VRIVYTPEEAKAIGGKMINQLLVTKVNWLKNFNY
jgi:hypothetical protein